MASSQTQSTSNTQDRLYFKLTPVSGDSALQSINKLTDNLSAEHKIAEDFREKLINTLTTEESDIFHGFLYAPKNNDITKQVIGKDGCYFHLTTEKTGVFFIWHNRKSNKFEFWGKKRDTINALNQIKHRIDIVTERVNGTA